MFPPLPLSSVIVAFKVDLYGERLSFRSGDLEADGDCFELDTFVEILDFFCLG